MLGRDSDVTRADPRGAPARPEAARQSGARTDIQGLRAIAVAAVVAFHLWPGAVTGGYVGVDVFFVISGFLITSHLLRTPVRGVGSLAQFWARRIRRLIPAASVVLFVTLVATVIWLPSTTFGVVTREVISAIFYVENWTLASFETNYLAADQQESPVQHYWSLSIEEQFYIVWPVVLGLTALVARHVARRRGADGAAARWVPAVVIGAIVLASLAWSAHLTSTDPSAAYFVSTTRAWELALGGLLAAVVAAWPRLDLAASTAAPAGAARAATAWLGLALVAWSVFRFDAATSFPGVSAVVPTLGTALVIGAAADGARWGPGGLLARRPMQWLGDVSYSTYLWHWPLIVIVPFAIGRPLGLVDTLGVLAASLLLAALSQRYVEDRLRWHPRLARSVGATFGMLLACVVVVGGAAAGVLLYADASERAAQDRFEQSVAELSPCIGAGVAGDPSCADPDLFMPPAVAADDKPAPYADGCWNNEPFTSRHTCTYGVGDQAADDGARVALFGNSHAGHWLPAMQDALEPNGWQVTTYLQSVCYAADEPLEFEAAESSQNCQDINRWAIDSIVAGGYDLVVMSNRTNQPLAGVPAADQAAVAQAGYQRTLDELTRAGIRVLVLRDVPAMPQNVPDCVAEHEDDPDACGAPPAEAIEPDPLAEAARGDDSGAVSLLDVNDFLCDDALCRPVVGGLIAYFDHGHLTATFARTLAPDVTGAMREALDGVPAPS
ncbi:acyltransferase [Isoptericola sp. NEAU-Y5]|uniref:Acyltransferase n=1 Tax=Isoptericola luteus TaxID=2879484 RepID=A0ABS7ZKE3_9MICO|nr:acyltransferase family protein [Isoptericola sp. NEAU-Y5]MCA5894319.1 acyltransferase [Isoptericola sp. NEAU-Y5]